MASITIVEYYGTEHSVALEEDYTLMEVATKNMVPGITAECGGACACATCHVYVDESWRDKLNPPDEIEESMLEFASGRGDNSRLSCQIILTPEMDGLVVRLPEKQG